MDTDLSLFTALVNIVTVNPQRYSEADYRLDNNSRDETSSISEEEHEKKESRFGVLLLSLGLMINIVQESDKVKELVLTSSLANEIKNIFEELIAREVTPQPTRFLHPGTGKSCVRLLGSPARSSHYSLSVWENDYCPRGDQTMGRASFG